MSVGHELETKVSSRAGRRCEYCLMHQDLQGASFHLEHVVPRALGGTSDLSNLALACPSCNLHKADRVETVDPETGALVPIFNPRIHRWKEHFRVEGYAIVGLSPVGRATIRLLDLNRPRRIQIRKAEALFGFFPP